MDSEKTKDYYNDLYSEKDDVFGNGAPLKEVEVLAENLKSGSVIELGAGQGRNSLYLAQKGFRVRAVELSWVGAAKIKQQAIEKQVDLDIVVADITTYQFQENFDGFVTTFVLHHIEKKDAIDLIGKMKEHTNEAGLHIVATFMNKGDLKGVEQDKFKPEENELKELYSDWDILTYTEKDTRMNLPDGAAIQNFTATIIAKKKTKAKKNPRPAR